MGAFTSWLEAMRRGERVELTPEQLKDLVEHTSESVGRRLRQKFPGGRMFAEDTGDELAQEMALWLMEAIRGDRTFPDRVTDSKSLYFALVDKAGKRSYDRWLRHRLDGGSAIAGANGSEEVNARTFTTIADGFRRGGPTFEEADANTVFDAIDEAFGDLVILEGDDGMAARAYQMSIALRLDSQEIGEVLGKSVASVNRYLRTARFCTMRRLGYAVWQLRELFAIQADQWLADLKKAGRE